MSKNLSSIVTVLGIGALGLLTRRRGSQYGQGFLDATSIHDLEKVPSYRRRIVDTLYIRNLETLPENLGEVLLGFPNLEELEIRNSVIGDLPVEIGMLTNLKKIRLENCRITSIPESIGDLVHLEHLDLENNKITFLPDSIGNLIKLRHLDISKNEVSYIPESIGNLINLQHLDLGNNNLTTLPKRLADLKSVDGLFWIFGNNIVKPSVTTFQYWVENMPRVMFRDIMISIKRTSMSELRRF
jgi:Leucine-rich repeat (LRR) protein